jgi:small subunit ribosomal protein S3
MVIGRSGNGIDELKAELEKMTKKTVIIEIKEVRRPELDAQLTAESVAQALERRVAFRRAMKQAIGRTMKAGAKGIKIMVSGRVGGAEIARSEMYSEGNVSLHTLRADIDYALAEADTTFGKLGVKVWINHGEVLDGGLKPAIPEEPKREGRKGRKDGERRPRRDGERRKNDRRREERPEAPKAVNPRVRKTPKVEPAVEAPQVEEAAVETTEE